MTLQKDSLKRCRILDRVEIHVNRTRAQSLSNARRLRSGAIMPSTASVNAAFEYQGKASLSTAQSPRTTRSPRAPKIERNCESRTRSQTFANARRLRSGAVLPDTTSVALISPRKATWAIKGSPPKRKAEGNKQAQRRPIVEASDVAVPQAEENYDADCEESSAEGGPVTPFTSKPADRLQVTTRSGKRRAQEANELAVMIGTLTATEITETLPSHDATATVSTGKVTYNTNIHSIAAIAPGTQNAIGAAPTSNIQVASPSAHQVSPSRRTTHENLTSLHHTTVTSLHSSILQDSPQMPDTPTALPSSSPEAPSSDTVATPDTPQQDPEPPNADTLMGDTSAEPILSFSMALCTAAPFDLLFSEAARQLQVLISTSQRKSRVPTLREYYHGLFMKATEGLDYATRIRLLSVCLAFKTKSQTLGFLERVGGVGSWFGWANVCKRVIEERGWDCAADVPTLPILATSPEIGKSAAAEPQSTLVAEAETPSPGAAASIQTLFFILPSLPLAFPSYALYLYASHAPLTHLTLPFLITHPSFSCLLLSRSLRAHVRPTCTPADKATLNRVLKHLALDRQMLIGYAGQTVRASKGGGGYANGVAKGEGYSEAEVLGWLEVFRFGREGMKTNGGGGEGKTVRFDEGALAQVREIHVFGRGSEGTGGEEGEMLEEESEMRRKDQDEDVAMDEEVFVI
ncbi:hypothetical protein K432DRAFT_406433 [Lepidopterella palustris CBS 459.81]|uniref:Uncharacterized protein n=1 Tax=Lepidopterella palustris CBS 459.81 TaxID=1314670 RepID=A0A8E2E6S9_9PEZI|nr:hypothetical protein K432DRAFT_406433 [Lepidopterella palustris CBS 459.81]